MNQILRTLFSTILNVEEENIQEGLTPDLLPKWDSFAHLSLVVAIEEQFGVSFDPEEIRQMFQGLDAVERALEAKLALKTIGQ